MLTVEFPEKIKKLYSSTIFSSVPTGILSNISESLTHKVMEFVWYHYQVEPTKDNEIYNKKTILEKQEIQFVETVSNCESNLIQNNIEMKKFTKYFYGDPNEDCPIKEFFCQFLLQLEPSIVRRFSFKVENDLLIEKFVFSIEKFFNETNLAIQNFLEIDDSVSAIELIYSCYLVEPNLFPIYEVDLVDFISNSNYSILLNMPRKLKCGHTISDEALFGILRNQKTLRCPYCRHIIDKKTPVQTDSLLFSVLLMEKFDN